MQAATAAGPFPFPSLAVSLPTGPGDALDSLAAFANQLSPWEAGVVGAYALIMAALSIYGLHRAWLVHAYYRHQSDAARAIPPDAPLPFVTIQLPLYNERFVVERLIHAVCRIEYPRDRLEIQVLDDSTDDTTAVARRAVERMAARGEPIALLHRDNRAGFKAGALEAGLRRAQGDIIAVFDADFMPRPDFLLRTLGAFQDPNVGAVQARWTFANQDASLLTRAQAMLLDGHFVFEQGGRSRSGRYFNFNGTAGLLRKAMIEDAGGWQHDTLTEDTDLSYRAQLRGWRFVYLQEIETPSELPDEMASFHVQQARWAKGLVQTGVKLLPRILREPIPIHLKSEAFLHLTANLSYPLMTLLAALMLPATMVRFHSPEPWLILFDGPVFLATFGSMAAFYLRARRETQGRLTGRDVALFPAALAAGIGLTITNTQAVLEALLGVETPFNRTAKTGGARKTSLSYARRAGWIAWANLGASLYFLGGALYMAEVENWAMLPFLGLFVAGFGWAGGMALWQAREQGRVAEADRRISPAKAA